VGGSELLSFSVRAVVECASFMILKIRILMCVWVSVYYDYTVLWHMQNLVHRHRQWVPAVCHWHSQQPLGPADTRRHGRSSIAASHGHTIADNAMIYLIPICDSCIVL
jgi:hypothetical protein